MFFLLSKSLVFNRSVNNNQKKNFCFPRTHDFHIHNSLFTQQLKISAKEFFSSSDINKHKVVGPFAIPYTSRSYAYTHHKAGSTYASEVCDK
jgi:hypothetical protein